MAGNLDTIWRSSSFDNFVTNLPIVFLKALRETPADMIRTLFMPRPWQLSDGDRVTFDSYALPQYAERSDGENATAKALQIAEGDTMTVKQAEYNGKFFYTNRMDTFDKEQLAAQFATTVVGAIRNVIDLELTHKILSYFENTTYTPKGKNATVDWSCANAKALVATNHNVTSGATFSNSYVTAGSLSGIAIAAMVQQGLDQFVNHLGEPVDYDPDTIVIPNNQFMVKKAFELFGSPLDPTTANHTMNIYNTVWKKKVIVLKRAQLAATPTSRLTTNTASYRFALIDSRYQENWQYQEAAMPQIVLKDSDIDTVLKVIQGVSFCAFATVQAQGLMGMYANVSKPQVTD